VPLKPAPLSGALRAPDNGARFKLTQLQIAIRMSEVSVAPIRKYLFPYKIPTQNFG
jgi:hypothetical protein